VGDEKPDIADVIRAIASGASADWDRVESPRADATLNPVIRELRVIARISEVHTGARAEIGQPPLKRDIDDLKHWGPLTLLERVGRGSYGDVYRAWDPRLEREVALKLLPSTDDDDGHGAAVIEEARLLARLRHSNVATVYGADRIDGRTGIWMEFVDGRDLEQIVREDGPLAPATVREIGGQLCAALDAVHRAGVLHRDIKASNIRRADDGRVVLLDFGSGRSRDQRAASRDLTGTPLYLAPEIFSGGSIDERSDLYSLGVVLFHLLTGRFPVAGATLDEVRRAHAEQQRQTVPQVFPSVPKQLAALIDTATDPSPQKRYQSATEFQLALTALGSHGSHNRWLIAALPLLAAGVIAGVFTAVAANRTRRPTDPPQLATVVAQPTGGAVQPAGPASPGLSFKGRDRALIAAFENRTGEALFDGTLEFALERELSNSSFVRVVPRERVNDVLHLMLRPADTKVDAQLAREICLRDGGIRALITGRVEKVGTTYVLTTQIVDPQDGAVARSLTEEAASQGDLLPALRRQGLRVREALGEMLSTIRSSEAALERVTTPSLHALQLYSRAAAFLLGDYTEWKDEPAEQLLRQAVSDDDRFASAYILLAYTLKHLGHPPDEVLSYASRAFQLATQTSDVERYFITGSYYGFLEGYSRTKEERESNHRQAIGAYQALLRIKPDHYWGSGNLHAAYEASHQEPEATNALIHMAEIRPSSVFFQLQVGERLLSRGETSRLPMIRRRLQALVPPDVARRSPRDAASVQLFEAWDAWTRYDLKRVRRIADDLLRAAAADDATRAVVTEPLQSIYIGLGRVSDYRRLVASLLPPEERNGALLAPMLQEIALEKPGAIDVLRDFVTTNYRDLTNVPFDWPLADALVVVGRLDDALALNRFADRNVSDYARYVIEGFNATEVEGRAEEGIRVFGAANQLMSVGFSLELLEATAVARAWKRHEQPQAGIAVLETALEHKWAAVPMTRNNTVAIWIQALDLLGDFYRETGRAKDAAAIDRQLSMLLTEADPDYPVLVRLKQRYADAR
jgi:serine/threonine-protein kinase